MNATRIENHKYSFPTNLDVFRQGQLTNRLSNLAFQSYNDPVFYLIIKKFDIFCNYFILKVLQNKGAPTKERSKLFLYLFTP